MTETHSEPRDKKPLYTRPKFIAACVVCVVFLILIIQNSQKITFDVFFWEAQVPAAMLYVIFALIGFLVGWLLRRGKAAAKAAKSGG